MVASTKRPGSIIFLLVGLVLLVMAAGFVLAHFLSRLGSTYKDDTYAFALNPPARWRMVTWETRLEFLRQDGERLTRAAQDGMRDRMYGGDLTQVVAWVHLAAKDKIAPILWVSYRPVGFQNFGKPELPKSKAMMQTKFQLP